MYSKCIVSPLIRQPRQTIGVVVAALGQALRGHRNLECAGHAHDCDVVVATPRPRESASRAPFSSPPVISSLKRETTMREARHYSPVANCRPCASQERACPFAHVCGRGDEAEQRRLEELCLVERHLEPRLTASIMYCTAIGALAASSAASVFASSSARAAGTTLLTRPIASASSALICRPVSSRSSAMPLPTSRARRCVPA